MNSESSFRLRHSLEERCLCIHTEREDAYSEEKKGQNDDLVTIPLLKKKVNVLPKDHHRKMDG